MFWPRTWALGKVTAGWSHMQLTARAEPAADSTRFPWKMPMCRSAVSPTALFVCNFSIPMQFWSKGLQAHLQSYSGCFALVQLVLVPFQLQSLWGQSQQSDCQFLRSGTSYSSHAWYTLATAHWQQDGNESELEATLLSTPQMLSKRIVATVCTISPAAGCTEERSLESLGSSQASQE